MAIVAYNSPNKLIAGTGFPVRVNLSFGIEKPNARERELAKMHDIVFGDLRPDLLMDLSVDPLEPEPWTDVRYIFDGPIGILPHYTLFDEGRGLRAEDLLDRIESVTSRGINFITIHCTPTRQLFDEAKRVRSTPVTSRGGSIVIRDMLLNGRDRSIFADIFGEVCEIAHSTGAVLNLGTAFRSASVADGLDSIVEEEIRIQSSFVEIARAKHAQVVLEGPGHIRLLQISAYWDLIKHLDVIPMPLGPMVTDRYPADDHVSAAIGAAQLMALSRGGVINAITSVEHRGGVPNLAQTRQGLRTALVAAQAVSSSFSEEALLAEVAVANRRSEQQSCVLDIGEAGCSRCQRLCPLILSSYEV
jgi:phosphomethylpyrimidine synthase